MSKISDLLSSQKVIISDGAWGTLLQQKGLRAGECPEYWNITRPNDVFDIAKSYIDAGSQIIETNSFGGSRIKLDQYGHSDKTFQINKKAAEISKKAAGENLVFGSIGPTGKILMMGETNNEELYEVFKEQSVALEEGGADVIVMETFTDLEELKIALKAVKENTKCETACTMTFDKLVTGEYRTMMGISPMDMVQGLNDLKPDIIGSNCGNGFENMIEVVKEFKLTETELPILIHANAGMPQLDENNSTIFPETPDHMAERLGELITAGARIIGGCCGTTPAHINKLVQEIS